MADLPFGWLRAGGTARVEGLRARPELNGKPVSIEGKDAASGRWRCKLVDSGEAIKVKADNLAPALSTSAEDKPESHEEDWLVRGANAIVLESEEKLGGQHVRVLSLDLGNGHCKCAVRATNEVVTLPCSSLRPIAGASRPTPTAAAPQGGSGGCGGGSDWAAAELERRRLAEGFRAGFSEGALVVLQGLKSMPELNGKQGTLVSWNSQSLRWNVNVSGMEATKALMPANLVPIGVSDRSSPDACQAEDPPEKRQRVE